MLIANYITIASFTLFCLLGDLGNTVDAEGRKEKNIFCLKIQGNSPYQLFFIRRDTITGAKNKCQSDLSGLTIVSFAHSK